MQDEWGLIHRLSQTFQASLIAMGMLSPSALVAYMYVSDHHHEIYRSPTALNLMLVTMVTTALAVALVAIFCYRRTGERAMLYMVWGLSVFSIVDILRLILPLDSTVGMGVSSSPRALLSGLLLLALAHWRKPHHNRQAFRWMPRVVLPIVALFALQGSVTAGLIQNHWVKTNDVMHGLTILFMLIGLPVALRITPINRPMYLCMAALLLNAQAATAFMIGTPWCEAWWLGQILCLVSIMVLGNAVTLAFLTSQSLSSDQTRQQMLELMRQAEEAAQAARRANAAKTRFMAAASHDLRQPLVPIKLFAELLEAETQGTPQGKLVRKLRTAVQSLDDLLNKMMEFSRLEAGAVHTRFERVRLGEILNRFHTEFGPVAAAKNLELRWVESSAVVMTDRILLEQVLRNLVQNALRYTDRGKILIGCRPCGNTVQLCVFDTGIGIPDDQQANIFTEFYQANTRHSDRQVGLGLGLATVERLSKVLKVDIAVRSVLGKGSCFTVTLSRTTERRAQIRPAAPQALPDPGPLRVLVLDDEAGVREGLVAALLRRNWEPLVASTMAEALETIESEGPPDAFITDLRLGPQECGLDAIAAVNRMVGRNVPSIIVTGDASHHRLAEAMASAWPILVKPFSMDELYTAVAEQVLTARAASNVSTI